MGDRKLTSSGTMVPRPQTAKLMSARANAHYVLPGAPVAHRFGRGWTTAKCGAPWSPNARVATHAEREQSPCLTCDPHAIPSPEVIRARPITLGERLKAAQRDVLTMELTILEQNGATVRAALAALKLPDKALDDVMAALRYAAEGGR